MSSLSSGLGWSSRGHSSRSWACQQVCDLGAASLPCAPHGAEPRLLGAGWMAVVCSSDSGWLGPAASWRTRHSPQGANPAGVAGACHSSHRMEKEIWNPWKFELEPILTPSSPLCLKLPRIKANI